MLLYIGPNGTLCSNYANEIIVRLRRMHRRILTAPMHQLLAGGEGFEPPLAESESAVLPLDDPPNRIGHNCRD